jgi:hypothetical protein
MLAPKEQLTVEVAYVDRVEIDLSAEQSGAHRQ